MAHNGQTISLGKILWKVLRNPMVSELTYEEAAEYSVEYLRLLGAPLAYEDAVENIKITTYKAELPCDLLEIRGVRYSNCEFSDGGIALRYASNTFHLSNKDASEDYRYQNYNITAGEATYTVQKGIIFTSQEEGNLEIAYKRIITDEEGYPLIPDNAKVVLGLEYFILHRYLEPLWLMGKLTDKAFNYISQQRDWYIGAGDASLRGVTPDQLETAMAGINRLLINSNSHQTSFKNYGVREVIKRQL